jgi:hypothetical protein
MRKARSQKNSTGIVHELLMRGGDATSSIPVISRCSWRSAVRYPGSQSASLGLREGRLPAYSVENSVLEREHHVTTQPEPDLFDQE